MGRAITQDIPYALDLPTYFHFSHSESKTASLFAIPFMFRTAKHVNEDGRSKSHVPSLVESLHSEAKANADSEETSAMEVTPKELREL